MMPQLAPAKPFSGELAGEGELLRRESGVGEREDGEAGCDLRSRRRS